MTTANFDVFLKRINLRIILKFNVNKSLNYRNTISIVILFGFALLFRDLWIFSSKAEVVFFFFFCLVRVRPPPPQNPYPKTKCFPPECSLLSPAEPVWLPPADCWAAKCAPPLLLPSFPPLGLPGSMLTRGPSFPERSLT